MARRLRKENPTARKNCWCRRRRLIIPRPAVFPLGDGPFHLAVIVARKCRSRNTLS